MSDFPNDAPGAGGGRQRWLKLAFIWGVWTLVGVFFALQLYVF